MNQYRSEPRLKKGVPRRDSLALNVYWIIGGLLLLMICGLIFFAANSKDDFVIIKGGKPELAPWRKEKLQKELEELDEAEQYVLIAGLPGWYPCYNCHGVTFYLLGSRARLEIWSNNKR